MFQRLEPLKLIVKEILRRLLRNSVAQYGLELDMVREEGGALQHIMLKPRFHGLAIGERGAKIGDLSLKNF